MHTNKIEISKILLELMEMIEMNAGTMDSQAIIMINNHQFIPRALPHVQQNGILIWYTRATFMHAMHARMCVCVCAHVAIVDCRISN